MARLALSPWSRRGAARAARWAGLLLVTLLGCSRPAQEERQPPAAAAAPSPAAAPRAADLRAADRARLVVFAASSLTDVFNALEQSFEAANASADVVLSYGGSQLLKLQISEGAPGDVFASADEAHMRELVGAGLAQPSQTFAHNELVIVVPPDNPAHLTQLEDLPRAERLVIGAPSVPVGAYTRELLGRAAKAYGSSFEQSVLSRVASAESNVRLVRAKVELGEADAAVVYRSDAAASTAVKQIALPPELNVRASYPIAVLTKAAQPELARRWVSHVLSPAGQTALASRGFLVSDVSEESDSLARGAR